MYTSSRKRQRRTAITTALAVAALVLTACDSSGGGASGDGPMARGVTIDAPSGVGSGYDQTARALEKVLTDTDLASRVEVKNTEGAGGTIALSQFVGKSGTKDLMVGGLSLVGAVVTNASDNKLSDITPIARLIGEYEVIVVPADSEYDDLGRYLEALAANPGDFPIAIGNQGGVDHMWGGTLVKEAGVDPTGVNFVTYDGGGEVTTALLGNQVSAGISGYAEFAQYIDDGSLKVLAVSSDEALEVNPDVPTIVDAGYPDAVLVNWRGIFAPPGLSDDDRQELSDAFAELSDSEEWAEVRDTNGWSDQFLDTDAFTEELTTVETDTDALLKDLGLA